MLMHRCLEGRYNVVDNVTIALFAPTINRVRFLFIEIPITKQPSTMENEKKS